MASNLIFHACLAFLLQCVFSVPLRLSLAEWTSYYKWEHEGPGTYAFGYDIEDPSSGNIQYRQEEKYANGTVIGSYGLLEPDGNVKIVNYISDERGYRASVEDNLQFAASQYETFQDQRTPPKYLFPYY